MAVDDNRRVPLYEGSTQYRNWRFSPDKLQETRSSLNAAAVAGIRKAFEADSAVPRTRQPGSSANVSFLTPEEENLLVKLYIGKISQLCGLFKFSEEVEATAITYLKRFYLKNTVMDWHPKNVMLTALFLATKTTNHPISLEFYASHIPKTTPSDVLDLEFLVAQSLGFEFSVWHAHRALWGLWLDIQTLPDISITTLSQVQEIALQQIRASRLTDAELIYTPSQIALACLSLASSDLAKQWAESKGSLSVLAIVENIQQLIAGEGTDPEVEAVREVDKRLRLCKNPEKVPGSKAYLAKKAEEEATALARRSKKADDVKKAMEAGDPFGDELGMREGALDDDD
ncbi:cyclin-like protein [Rickenella mellea]|uniref:Cyclin-like protein n=1 Tax=Rickenella mellea TaxID=50990 RepID=A0A4Y7QM17_9AGAM|nr:cyclin-like protein [Rickenella mellea]